MTMNISPIGIKQINNRKLQNKSASFCGNEQIKQGGGEQSKDNTQKNILIGLGALATVAGLVLLVKRGKSAEGAKTIQTEASAAVDKKAEKAATETIEKTEDAMETIDANGMLNVTPKQIKQAEEKTDQNVDTIIDATFTENNVKPNPEQASNVSNPAKAIEESLDERSKILDELEKECTNTATELLNNTNLNTFQTTQEAKICETIKNRIKNIDMTSPAAQKWSENNNGDDKIIDRGIKGLTHALNIMNEEKILPSTLLDALNNETKKISDPQELGIRYAEILWDKLAFDSTNSVIRS